MRVIARRGRRIGACDTDLRVGLGEEDLEGESGIEVLVPERDSIRDHAAHR